MKNKTLGIIFLVVLFAAVVSVIYYWQVANQPALTMPSNDEPQKVTYNNQQYNFEVKYYKTFPLDTSGIQTNYFDKSGVTLASISIPRGRYDTTNFSSAQVTFASKPNTTESDCQTYTSGVGSKKLAKTAVLDAGTFYMDEMVGAAAGTTYTTKIYRILRDSGCFEANLTVGISNIGNYEPGSVMEVNEEDVWNELSAVLASLKFNPTTSTDDVNSYSACVEAGYGVMKSKPEQCATPDGTTFTNYEACIQVIAFAKNPETGEVRQFPTPCDIPKGWQKVDEVNN